MHLNDSALTAVRRIGFVVGTAATFVVVGVWLFGGFEFTLAGVRLRSHNLVRPFVVGGLGWVIYVAAGGRFAPLRSWNADSGRRIGNLVAVALALTTLLTGIAYNATAIGGSDSYGYGSQVELWLDGDPRLDQPWVSRVPWPNAASTFTPLGYTTYYDATRPTTIVPTYPPGLPWLMAAGKAISGQEGMFWPVPILAALTVLATYGIGCRLASPMAGLIAAFLMATTPVQLFMQMQAMSDAPAAGAWALAIYFLLGSSRRDAAVAGVAAALAITIRPNLMFCAGILGVWYVVRMWRAQPGERPARFHDGLLYAATLSIGLAAIAASNYVLNGSPVRFGYGALGGYFSRDNIWPNARDYFIHLVEWQTPLVLIGFAALALPIRAVWPAARDRAAIPVLGAFVLAIWAFYCYYLHFEAWWYLRFHLPLYPVLMTGVGAALTALFRRGPTVVRVLVIASVLVAGVYTLRLGITFGAFDYWKAERHYAIAARMAGMTTGGKSVILAMQHSGSVRYYGGRVTIRYDLLDPAWLDRAVDWLQGQGIRPYLLIDNWEIPDVEARFAGQKTLHYLKQPPAAQYRGTTTVNLWDLSRRGDGVYPPTLEFVDDPENSRSFEPAPLLVPFE